MKYVLTADKALTLKTREVGKAGDVFDASEVRKDSDLAVMLAAGSVAVYIEQPKSARMSKEVRSAPVEK